MWAVLSKASAHQGPLPPCVSLNQGLIRSQGPRLLAAACGQLCSHCSTVPSRHANVHLCGQWPQTIYISLREGCQIRSEGVSHYTLGSVHLGPVPSKLLSRCPSYVPHPP